MLRAVDWMLRQARGTHRIMKAVRGLDAATVNSSLARSHHITSALHHPRHIIRLRTTASLPGQPQSQQQQQQQRRRQYQLLQERQLLLEEQPHQQLLSSHASSYRNAQPYTSRDRKRYSTATDRQTRERTGGRAGGRSETGGRAGGDGRADGRTGGRRAGKVVK